VSFQVIAAGRQVAYSRAKDRAMTNVANALAYGGLTEASGSRFYAIDGPTGRPTWSERPSSPLVLAPNRARPTRL
jgi:hypothetical protein